MVSDNDDGTVSLEVVAAVAGLAIKAGLSMTSEGDSLQLPLRGWAPPPAEGMPEVEYGAALAVQAIVSTFGLDLEQVEAVADALMQRAVD